MLPARGILQGKPQLSVSTSPVCDDTVAELLANRCISRTPQRPHVYSPLSVVANAEGKLRLVLNLRYLNQILHKVKFKYEDHVYSPLSVVANAEGKLCLVLNLRYLKFKHRLYTPYGYETRKCPCTFVIEATVSMQVSRL